jgi:histidine triad (HIT) family protein
MLTVRYDKPLKTLASSTGYWGTMNRMEDSIFTKIIRGDIPSHKIYEDDKTFAFLDIHPVQPGHVLIIPKKQVEFVWDLEDEDYQAVMATTKKIALRLRDVLGKRYVHERIVGTDVPHAHVHLIPFTETSELLKSPDEDAEPDHPALAELAKKLMF